MKKALGDDFGKLIIKKNVPNFFLFDFWPNKSLKGRLIEQIE